MNGFSSLVQQQIEKFNRRHATVGVVGLGYVGLPLVRAMHDAGFQVVGFDIDPAKIEMLKRGKPYLHHLGEALPRTLAASDRFVPTTSPSELGRCDAIALCVPTPLGKHQDPDLSFVQKSTEMVAGILRRGQLVSLESTSYPGTTREICLPILERAGLKCGEDFFLSFSPEREDPGREGIDTRGIPRLVGGIDPGSGAVAHAMYAAAIQTVILLESAEVAEAAKLLENTYRAVNIALVNELKPVLTDMGIDIWQVIKAASTKPFGFQPFYPGPGLGGHCIPIDPFYLTFKAREYGHATRFIELAGEINHRMPQYVIDRLSLALNDESRALRNARVLIIGIAYKPNIDDIREAPSAEIIKKLLELGATVSYHDPLVPTFPDMRKYSIDLESVPLTPETLSQADAVLIVTDHRVVDYQLIAEHAGLVVDTRDAMSRTRSARARIVKA
jgi:UDP-N-acetyl-D-glucosamine dehydrogenase